MRRTTGPSLLETPDLLGQFKSALVKKNVGIVEFAESSEYCGKMLYPRQRVLLKLIFLEELDGYEEDVLNEWIRSSTEGGEVVIAPQIRKRIELLRERGYPHFTLNQLVLGRRSGKGYMTGLATTKKIYDLIQLEDPASYFGVAPGENIYFSIIADSQDQAKKYQFKDIRNWLVDCKPLKPYIGQPLAESISIFTPFDLARVAARQAEGIKISDALASLRVEAFAKNARTVRGNASISMILDEMAHIMPGESNISDTEIFKATEPALAQFKHNALLFANSSPWQMTGKFYELYEQALMLDNGEPVFPSQFMIQAPSWEMYKDWERDSRFRHAIIVDPEHDFELKQKELADPESFRVEYRAQFREVISPYLDPRMVDRAFDPEFSVQAIGHDVNIARGGVAQYQHRYRGHADPSATGANFGIAVGHVEWVSEWNEGMGQMIEVPHVVFDFVDAFYPADFPNGEIDWLEIMPVFVDLIKNFQMEAFTFDQFNSEYPIQMLQAEASKLGMWETQIYMERGTVPHNRDRSRSFKSAINLGRVHIPHPFQQENPKSLELARNELKFLQLKGDRVEKQTVGPIQTKDIADCIMEVTHALIGESLINNLDIMAQPIRTGAQGGFSIGGDISRRAGSGPFDAYYGSLREPTADTHYGLGPGPTIGRTTRKSAIKRRW